MSSDIDAGRGEWTIHYAAMVSVSGRASQRHRYQSGEKKKSRRWSLSSSILRWFLAAKRPKISQEIVLRLSFWKSAFTLIWPLGYNALPSDVSCPFVLGHLVTHSFQFFLKRASESENVRVLRRCQMICVFATLPEFPINRNRWHDLSETRLIPCPNEFWLMGPTLPRHVMLKPL